MTPFFTNNSNILLTAFILCAINSYRILNYFTKVFALSVLFMFFKKEAHMNVPTLTQTQKIRIMQFVR